MVLSGTTHPVVGASVSLYSTGIAAASLATATADAAGHFSLNFTCPAAGTLIYVTANGGNAGGGVNSAIQLASALGACGSLPTSFVVNEFTSAAAAWALSGFATLNSSAPTVTLQGKSPGLNQAFVTLTNLVTPATGTFPTQVNQTNATAVKTQLDTLANAMGACNLSAGATSAACAELFTCATAGAAFVATGQACTVGSSAARTDTWSAAIAVAQNAGTVSPAGIYDASLASAGFTPAMTAAPGDWSLVLSFSVTNHGPLAIDAGGHVWLLASDPNPVNPSVMIPLAVFELDADGSLNSPSLHGFTAGGISSIAGNDITNFAIDTLGQVWISGTGATIAAVDSSGNGLAGAPYNAGTGPDDTAAVTIDSMGHPWFISGNTQPTVFEFSTAGVNLSSSAGFTASNCPCNGAAADASGNVWVVGSAQNQYLAAINSLGVQGNIFAPSNLSASFYQLAADAASTLWMTDRHNHAIWQFTPSGGGGSYAGPFSNAAGAGTVPKGIAIDGAGHKWVANQGTAGNQSSVTEYTAAGTANLSNSDGFGFGVITGAYSVGIDGSGNVWVADGGSVVAEFVGLGAPTKNPIASGVISGSFAP